MAKAFTAKYTGGTCSDPYCEDMIEAGQDVVYVDQELFHLESFLLHLAPDLLEGLSKAYLRRWIL